MKGFLTVGKLGNGSFGQVYRVRRTEDGQEYAMKRVKMDSLKKEKDRVNALNQIRILAGIDHPNIIQYKEAFFDESQPGLLCVVMQLASHGDLAAMIKQRFKRGEGFFQSEIWRYGLQMLQGLKELHSMNIVHRDLKPANIFFSSKDQLKLGDLNVSTMLKQDGLVRTQTGTPNYASLEVWNNQAYSFQCDVWSFGCIMYQLCTFRPPFRSKNMEQLFKKVKQLKYDKIPSRYSLMLEQTIAKCLTRRDRRASVDELIQIFSKYTVVKQNRGSSLRKNKSAISLLKVVQFPRNTQQFSSLLPHPKYTRTQTDQTNPQSQTSINNQQNVLDRFLKQPSRPLIRRRLNNKAYVDSVSKITQSYKQLPESKLQLGQRLAPNLSFKSILKSIQDQKIAGCRHNIQKMGMKRRNIKVGSYLKL